MRRSSSPGGLPGRSTRRVIQWTIWLTGPMVTDWSRAAPELLIRMDRTGAALALQIQEQLRVAIREGRLVAGERLPSTRGLAQHLGVSRGTVVEVYEQLVAEGYLDSAVGSGTRVAPTPGAGRQRTQRAHPPQRTQGTEPALRPKPAIDFEYGIPDLGSVPLRDWVWAVGEATRTLPTAGTGRRGTGRLATSAGRVSPPTTGACAPGARPPTTPSWSAASAKVWPSPWRPWPGRGSTSSAGGPRPARARRHRPARGSGGRGGSGRRRGPRRGRAARDPGPGRPGHAGPPVPHRGRAQPVPPPGAGGLGRRGRRRDHRGRLRRRVPLRPAAGRIPAGTGSRTGVRPGFRQQDASRPRSGSAGCSCRPASSRRSTRRSS